MGRGRINYREKNFVLFCIMNDDSGAPGICMNGPEMNERGREWGGKNRSGLGRNVNRGLGVKHMNESAI